MHALAATVLLALGSADELGLSVGALAREEGSGSHTLLLSPELRYQRVLLDWLAVAGTWTLGASGPSSPYGVGVVSQLVSARAQGRVPLGKARLELEAGPALRLEVRTTTVAGAVEEVTGQLGFAVVGGAFVAADLAPLVVRLGVETFGLPRLDWRFSAAVLWRLP